MMINIIIGVVPNMINTYTQSIESEKMCGPKFVILSFSIDTFRHKSGGARCLYLG